LFACVARPIKFRYEPGKTYTYDYEIQAETSMSGATQEKAVVIINGQADIEVIDQCDFVLKVSVKVILKKKRREKEEKNEETRT
jgi:transposase-like protein